MDTQKGVDNDGDAAADRCGELEAETFARPGWQNNDLASLLVRVIPGWLGLQRFDQTRDDVPLVGEEVLDSEALPGARADDVVGRFHSPGDCAR